MWKRIKCWILGHDYDMTFPGKTLDWLFVCKRCKHTTRDMYRAAKGRD